jgi:hypothetical protein
VVIALLNRFATSLWAQEGAPHYIGMFSTLATLGSFAFVCVYFLLSLGSLRGLADHANRARVALAAGVGMLVTAGALFGGVYKVPTLTLEVQLFGVAVFAVGFFVRARTNEVVADAVAAAPAG